MRQMFNLVPLFARRRRWDFALFFLLLFFFFVFSLPPPPSSASFRRCRCWLALSSASCVRLLVRRHSQRLPLAIMASGRRPVLRSLSCAVAAVASVPRDARHMHTTSRRGPSERERESGAELQPAAARASTAPAERCLCADERRQR